MAGLSYGTIVVAGLSFPIHQIELTGGEVVFHGHRDGKSPELTGEPITVFGRDGQGLFQGGRIDIEQVRRNGHVEVRVALRLDQVD